MSAAAPDFSLDALPEDWKILLIDDLQYMQEERELQTLCELIRSNPERRFVLLSRGALRGQEQCRDRTDHGHQAADR